jgi:hypothetical protein
MSFDKELGFNDVIQLDPIMYLIFVNKVALISFKVPLGNILKPQKFFYRHSYPHIFVPSSFRCVRCFSLAAAAAGMEPMVDRTLRLLSNCCVKNSSSFVAILIKSGVVDLEIIMWNLSHSKSLCMKIKAGLEETKRFLAKLYLVSVAP